MIGIPQCSTFYFGSAVIISRVHLSHVVGSGLRLIGYRSWQSSTLFRGRQQHVSSCIINQSELVGDVAVPVSARQAVLF